MGMENETESCSHTTDELPVRVLIVSGLSLLLVCILLGNTLVMLAIAMVRRLWTPPNILLLSLAASDWLVGIVVVPMALITELQPVSGHACDVIFLLENLLCTSSIINLTAIAVDRYLLLTRPFIYASKRTLRRMGTMILVVWISSIIIAVPPVFARKLFHGEKTREKELQWGDLLFELAATVLAFFLPLILMFVLYGRIFILAASLAEDKTISRQSVKRANKSHHYDNDTLQSQSVPLSTEGLSNGHEELSRSHSRKASHNPQEQEQYQNRLRRQSSIKRLMEPDKKAVRTLGVIMGAFTVCWLPYYMVQLLRPIYRVSGMTMNIAESAVKALQWLGYFNSLLNPFIYSAFNRDLREPLIHLLHCGCATLSQRMRQRTCQEQFGLQQGNSRSTSSYRRQKTCGAGSGSRRGKQRSSCMCPENQIPTTGNTEITVESEKKLLQKDEEV